MKLSRMYIDDQLEEAQAQLVQCQAQLSALRTILLNGDDSAESIANAIIVAFPAQYSAIAACLLMRLMEQTGNFAKEEQP